MCPRKRRTLHIIKYHARVQGPYFGSEIPSRSPAGEQNPKSQIQNPKSNMAFTYFFRDIATLNAIRDHVIPELRKHRYINVWDAGCAMGPEPYSLAIIFKESLGYYEFKRLKIYATDLDEESNEFGKILAEGILTVSK